MAKQTLRTVFTYPTMTPTTGWFPSRVLPIRNGDYEVECPAFLSGEARVIDRMDFHRGHWFHSNGELVEGSRSSPGNLKTVIGGNSAI